ncbi:FAD-dependent oxidoreductase [Pseudofrankia sp. BMG5.36]|uniref:FAD-dependent oxidoreductase n=1 Tax=Pseudofrankia sp. BMG5.36 TaxID=1834512 RepID=UPI0008DA3D3B|nr:FAD-dependent oxidoreductase [Pseudofrankia sp. BMG5.36]OHV43567.1 3-ketosteroid-delta-1-dehydrogenase [Pseudofrankia sp. BMG5.36]
MPDWEYATDVVVVGSGGGLCGAVTAAVHGLETLVIEKEPLIGGSTAMSGGVLWLPNNPLMRAEGVPDSFDEAMAYFDSVVGEVRPASSKERRAAYINEGVNMIRFLQDLGMSFRRCEGYSDYYAEMRGVVGYSSRGRSIEPTVTDGNELGPWLAKLRPGIAASLGVVVFTGESAALQTIKRSPRAVTTAAKVAARTAAGKLKGESRLANGAALVAQALKIAIEHEVSIWTETPLVDLVVENGRVTGVVAKRCGRDIRIRANRAVLLSSGGFAQSAEMRQRYSMQPNSGAWTVASPGDTGEVIEAAIQYGAASDLMDDAWWIPASVMPDGRPAPHVGERSKPGSIIVDQTGDRYFNEALSYMEAGRQLYARNESTGGKAVPSWLIMDGRNRSRYLFSFQPNTPDEWISSGYMKRADTIEELARQCGIDPVRLSATVDRFNGSARQGVDPDFHRGEGAYERYMGDALHKPNPALGPVEKPPFHAVALYPGDVGTSGGLLSDEFARVLDTEQRPIAGLYATGNCTATVMGHAYPGAGASIAASFVFAYIGMKHAAQVASRSR